MKEYSIFVETVRKWKQIDAQNGFEKAIEECIKNDILREYLQRKSKEVLNMLIGEYDYETDIAVQRAEEREMALAEGFQRGIEQGFCDGSHQAKLETARLMRQANCGIAFIEQMTGLSQGEVEALT